VELVNENEIGFHRENEEALTHKKIDTTSDGPKWKADMMNYLETAEAGDKPFFKDGLCLNPEEIAQIKVALMPLGRSIMASITSYSVKLIKVNGEAL